jgi:archaellum biogenesis ATPase FlaH
MKQQLNAFYVENSDGDMELNEGILDNIFDNTTQDCDKNWLDSEFKTWIEWKNLETSFIDAYSYMKLNPVDSDNIKNVVATVKDLINERNNISFDDNFGTDTSDITEYYLETKESFSTGYSWIDSKLGGGLSYKTITVFFGPPKIGKSLWLGNLAHNITRYGHNVALVTLELSEKKYLKRIASNAMNIPIDTYADFINDTDALKDKIKDYVSTDGQTLIIPGKLIIKEFPASSISANDLESYMKKLEETTKLKFDVIVIDYLNLMNDARQSSADGTYLKIKNIAEQLRSLAMRKEYAVITATQTNRGGIGKQGVLEMNDVSESIGLPQTVDALFSITKDMIDENNGKYTLGATALRDAEGMGEKNQFDFNKKYMRITEEIQDSNNVLNADIMNIDMMI